MTVNTPGWKPLPCNGVDLLPVLEASWAIASCLDNPLTGFMGGPHRPGPPHCPPGPDPRSVTSGVLGFWPYKKPVERGLQGGEVMGCNRLSV